MDKWFQKEYERKKKAGRASKEYLRYIYALSLIDGSKREHNKCMNDFIEYFDDVVRELGKREAIKMVAGKSWVGGFEWAIRHIDELRHLPKLKQNPTT